MALSDRDVAVLDAGVGLLDDDLLEMAVAGSEKSDRVVAGAGGRDGRQVGVERQNRLVDDGQFAAERRVDVEAAEVFTDLGQLRVDAVQARGDEVEASSSGAGEAPLDVLHELASEKGNSSQINRKAG